jgi:hypothetical protein
VSLSERAPKNSAGLPGGRVHVFASIIEEIELFRGNIRVIPMIVPHGVV